MTRTSTRVLLALLAVGGLAARAHAAEKPNIVFIVADDMGYADCGVQGCKDVPTPHVDSIAQAGLRFTDGYVTGTVCSPSRAALMTGRYNLRDGVPDWVRPGGRGINAEVPLLASYLTQAGYRTALVGKWHLGEQDPCNPLNRGFNEFFGFLGGGRSYWPDKAANIAKVGHYTQLVRGREPVAETEYTTFAFGREAVNFIQQQKGKPEPFFLYLAFNAVHTPMEAPPDYLKKFNDIKDKGRHTYAGMLSAMDDTIGRVLDALRAADFEQNTFLCFISDNGGPITRNAPNSSRNTPLRGGKGEVWEGGVRVPFFIKWPGHLPAGGTFSQPVVQMDLTATALALAGAEADAKWPLDGVNLTPYLKGEQKDPHATLCWFYENQCAIRQGQWKLVFTAPDKSGAMPVKGLFDLSSDIGEKQNLAADHADEVKKMQAAWLTWRDDVLKHQPAPQFNTEKAKDSP